MHDAVGGGGAGRRGEDLVAVAHVVVDPQVEFGLLGAPVLEVRVGGGFAGDEAGRPVEGILLEVAAADFEAGGFAAAGVGHAAEEGALFAGAELGVGAGQLPRRVGDQVDHAAHRVGAPTPRCRRRGPPRSGRSHGSRPAGGPTSRSRRSRGRPSGRRAAPAGRWPGCWWRRGGTWSSRAEICDTLRPGTERKTSP